MKLHIESMQEKMGELMVERDIINREKERMEREQGEQMEKLNKIIKTLEEELTRKVDKLKFMQTQIHNLRDDNKSLLARIDYHDYNDNNGGRVLNSSRETSSQ